MAGEVERRDGLATPLVGPAEAPTGGGAIRRRKGGLGGLLAKLRQNGALVFYTVCFLLSSVGNTLYFKRMTSTMPNYLWFLTQLAPITFVPLFGVMAGAALLHDSGKGILLKFVVMGCFDSVGGVLLVLGGVRTSGLLQVILQQMAIPFSVFFSMAILGKRFHAAQIGGAAMIILGTFFANMGGPSGGAAAANEPIFNFIFLLAMVPMALSSVYKEFAFRGFDGDLNCNVLQFWVTAFQVFGNFISAPIYSLSILGQNQVPLSRIPGIASGGSRCLFLQEEEDAVYESCGLPGEKLCDDCQAAPRVIATYLTFNLLYNIFALLVIKHGSAALAFLLSTLRLPLASIAFMFPVIAGRDAVQPTLGDVAGLVVILAGLGSYRHGGVLLKRQEKLKNPSLGISEVTQTPSKRNLVLRPIFSAGLPGAQPAFVVAPEPRQARSADRVRSDLYRRLGTASPLQSPGMRGRSPPRPSPGGIYEDILGDQIMTISGLESPGESRRREEERPEA